MEESENKSDLQERWRRGCKQLPPNLLTALDVQTVLDNNVRKIIPNAWPISSRRSGGIQKNLPNNGSSCDVQNAGTKMSGVGNQNVDSDGGLHEGIRLHLPQLYLGGTAILQCRTWLRLPLEKIYKDQKASVQTDEESEIFDIQKGSKQGDPLSSLLFNTVLQYALKNVVLKWHRTKGMGIYLSDQERDCLTNLRFADDVMLFATSKGQMQNTMCEFKEATEKVGFTIHPNKTKILSSESSMNLDTGRYMKIGDMDIEILAKSESVKYLGQRISFYQQETIEIKSRIRAAWTTFRKYRQELTSKKYMLKLRLRLFDATVSPTHCYASGTWSPSREHERMIQSTQRKMLRLIIQTKRKYKKIEKKSYRTHDWGRKWRQNWKL